MKTSAAMMLRPAQRDDAKSEQDDSAPAESEEGAVDMEDAGEDPAMIEAGKKDRDDPEEEKIADVGAAADEEEALIEAGQEKEKANLIRITSTATAMTRTDMMRRMLMWRERSARVPM